MLYKKIIVCGSLSFDYIFNVNDCFSNYILPEKIHQINFSIVSETHQKSFGGTAGNQAFYLAKLGVFTSILASAGSDFYDYRKFLKKSGINSDFIKISRKKPTATGFVITDKKDNQIWAFSKGAMKEAAKLSLRKEIKNTDDTLIVIAPNEPIAITNLIRECIKEKLPFVFDPAFYIPFLKKDVLVAGIKHAKIIFGNDYEIAFMERKTAVKIVKNLKKDQIVVSTLGESGSQIYHDGKKHQIGIYKTRAIDPTGAGDAYRSGFLYGYINDNPVDKCGWMGAVSASFAIETKGTINRRFNKSGFEKRLKSLKK